MKKLRDFLEFNSEAFFKDKLLQVVSVNEWIDYDTKEHMGVKADLVVLIDKCQYKTSKPGEQVTNRFATFTAKVKRDHIQAQLDDRVRLVNPVGKVWGDYGQNLSVTCDDLEVIAPAKKA